jgi:hypothetical protein
MTTIVINELEKKIYCDGRCVSGNVIESDHYQKWFCDKDGQPWFYSGTVCDAKKLFDHFIGGGEQKDWAAFDSNIYGMKGQDLVRVGVYQGNLWVEPLGGSAYLCYGSGGNFALAAIDHGKSPIDAIEYAKTRDPFTGGKISCYDYVKKEWQT